MCTFLSLPSSVLDCDIFSFCSIYELLALRLVSKNLKSRVDSIYSVRIEYLTKKLSEAESFQLPNDLKHFGASTMQASISRLNTIHPASVTELKLFANPPVFVKEVLELVYLILAPNPKTPSWTDICRDMLHLNFLTDLANYQLKPMKFSLYTKAEDYLSRIDINILRSFSITTEVLVVWCENVIAVNRMFHQDKSGKAYIENEQRKMSNTKEIRILDNLANVGIRMKNNIREAKTIRQTKQVTTSESKTVVKASPSKEESKKVKEVKKSSPAQPLSKLIGKPVSKTAKKPSNQGIEGLMITPAMNLMSKHNKK
jgi:hypothetical protein